MMSEIVAFARAQAKAAARRAAILAFFGLASGLFVLVAIAGLFVALFFWLEPHRGPAAASLICAGVALVLAILALLPLAFRRRPPPTPPEEPLAQFVSVVAKTAPNLAPRHLILAALVGAALALSARRTSQQIRPRDGRRRGPPR